MSTVGRRIRNGRASSLFRSEHAPNRHGAETLATNTPYWLLWSTGIVALVLGIAAFVLWGIGSAGILFDMIVAFCT
jgi:hypothetical protein